MRRKEGFSLLEAMVALAIAAMSLIALMGLQYQLIEGQRRNEAAIAKADLRRDALVVVREINPDERPQGEVELAPGRTLRWTSTALTEPRLSAGFPNGDGRYMITLYRVSVEILKADGAAPDRFDVERTGWTLAGAS